MKAFILMKAVQHKKVSVTVSKVSPVNNNSQPVCDISN